MRGITENELQGRLFKITWPIFIDALLFMLLGSVDIFMLGKYSDNAVAAVGVVNQVMSMVNLLFGIITAGTMILCAQYIGAKKSKEEVIRLCGVSLGFNTFIGVILSFIMVACGSIILKMMNIAPELMIYSKEYIKIVGGFTFVQSIAMTFTAISRSYGFTKLCMYVTLGINIFNVMCNYVLIFGNLGAPELGVIGAAIATVLSKSIGAVVLGILIFRKVLKGFSLKHFRKFPIDELKSILKLGLPAAGEQISYSLSKLVGTVILTLISIEAMTANSYINNICMFVYLFSLSLGQGCSILVGQLVGKGDKDEAYNLCMWSLKRAILASAILGSLVAVLGKDILGLFTSNSTVLAIGTSVLFINAILEPGRAVNLVIINSLRASGDVKFPVYVGIISMWIVGVGVGYILSVPMGLGLVGIFIGLTLDEWIRGVIMYYRWKSRKWHTKILVTSNNEIIA